MNRPTVLIVDDERSTLEGWTDLLQRQYRLVCASNGEDALAVLRADPVDVIVCEERMPGMSGIDMLRRARVQSPATVAIMVTGSAAPDIAIRAINEAGVFRFLRKPCDGRELSASIADAVVAQQGLRAVRDAERRHLEQGVLSERFDRAMANLWLATQPIGRASSRSAFAYEVLVRTTEPSVPNGGVFVHLAEQTGRVLELEQTIRRRAALLAEELPLGAQLFVNVHAESLRVDDLGSPQCPLTAFADRVVLEVTENAGPDDIIAAGPRLAAYRRAGFRLALDDLGAGAAGLGSVAALQPDFAKLDQALVRNVHEDVVRSRIVRGLVGLCRELGIELVAEGVETDAEYHHLVRMGCDLVQGYRVARPARGFPTLDWPDHALAA
jgi:EAL domain-containing protein (putative c-di-GMP-specific phosphodiesterase class I)/CheY-like chemotaxis protein